MLDRIKVPEIGIDWVLTPWHTIVGGDAATGKTYLVNRLRDYLSIENNPLSNELLILNYTSQTPLETIKNSEASIVIIDNGDLLLKKTSRTC